MGRADEGDWYILTTAATRTLPLARSLASAGLLVWTPMRVERRPGRGKKRKDIIQVEVPITPTFVFVAKADLPEVLRIRSLPLSPHPSFSVLRYRDRIPAIRDASLAPLRAAEDRFRQSLLKSTRYHHAIGSKVSMTKGAFAGMKGVIEGGNGKEARVNFGSGFIVSIASYLIETDVVQEANKPALGIAA